MRDAIGEDDVLGGITSGSLVIFSARKVPLLSVTAQPIAGEASAIFELELRMGCFPFSFFCETCDCLPQVKMARKIPFNLDITAGSGWVIKSRKAAFFYRRVRWRGQWEGEREEKKGKERERKEKKRGTKSEGKNNFQLQIFYFFINKYTK